MSGMLEPSTSKPSGTEQMPSLQGNPITPTLFKETTPTTKTPKSIHMPWTLTPSALKNLPKKKGKNASRKEDASDAGNPDITQETAPRSKATTVTLTPTPRHCQGNPKNPEGLRESKKS